MRRSPCGFGRGHDLLDGPLWFRTATGAHLQQSTHGIPHQGISRLKWAVIYHKNKTHCILQYFLSWCWWYRGRRWLARFHLESSPARATQIWEYAGPVPGHSTSRHAAYPTSPNLEKNCHWSEGQVGLVLNLTRISLNSYLDSRSPPPRETVKDAGYFNSRFMLGFRFESYSYRPNSIKDCMGMMISRTAFPPLHFHGTEIVPVQWCRHFLCSGNPVCWWKMAVRSSCRWVD